MTSPIFYLDELNPTDSLPFSVHLEGDEAHHALKVKRLKVGEGILISDGKGQKYQGFIESIDQDSLIASLESSLDESQDFQLILVQALAKSDRDLLAIEMATELGISSVVPWEADRSIVRWKGNRADKAHTKWENTVKAAAKQARRGLIPEVEALLTSAALSKAIQGWSTAGFQVLILHEDATQKLASVLSTNSKPKGYVFVVGPEGGISPQELASLEAAGAVIVGLGHEVLRSSTAGAAVLSAINFSSGRWS